MGSTRAKLVLSTILERLLVFDTGLDKLRLNSRFGGNLIRIA